MTSGQTNGDQFSALELLNLHNLVCIYIDMHIFISSKTKVGFMVYFVLDPLAFTTSGS